MNPIHPVSYHVVKVEQEHQLARLERRRAHMSQASSEAHRERAQRASLTPVRQRLAVAAGSALLMVSLVAGAVLAGVSGSDAGSPTVYDNPSSGGGGSVYLLR